MVSWRQLPEEGSFTSRDLKAELESAGALGSTCGEVKGQQVGM